jgi:hypothetical protein
MGSRTDQITRVETESRFLDSHKKHVSLIHMFTEHVVHANGV